MVDIGLSGPHSGSAFGTEPMAPRYRALLNYGDYTSNWISKHCADNKTDSTRWWKRRSVVATPLSVASRIVIGAYPGHLTSPEDAANGSKDMVSGRASFDGTRGCERGIIYATRRWLRVATGGPPGAGGPSVMRLDLIPMSRAWMPAFEAWLLTLRSRLL